MVDRTHQLSVTKQAKAIGISRGSAYYKPRPVSSADLALMRRIDELHLAYPFAGSRMLQGLLLGEGYKVGRLHVRTPIKRMGIEAIYRRPNTSKPAPGHKRSTPIFCVSFPSSGPTRSGRWVLPTSPWPVALCIWPQLSIGSHVGFYPGGSRRRPLLITNGGDTSSDVSLWMFNQPLT